MLDLLIILSESVTSESTSETLTAPTYNIFDTIIKYSVLVAIIFISLILIAIVRRSFKKEASIKKTKSKCIKAKNYAIKIKKQTSKQELLIASTKLNKLTSLLTDATWIATRTAEDKKDVILDDISSSIDNLATYASNFAEDAFYTKEEYENKLDYIISTIESIEKRIDAFVKDTSG